MKPNDKAIDAEAVREVKSILNTISPVTDNETIAQNIVGKIIAAYAAQFQSEDYAELVERLRKTSGMHQGNMEIATWLKNPDGPDAADAIEAVLAEREALNFELAARKEWPQARAEMLEELAKVRAERDALAARLAPVEDEELVEICAKGIASSKANGYEAWMQESRAAIAAIRPHIETAERERCAKIAEGSFLFDIETWLNSTKKEMTAHVAKAIAAAIRSGK